METHSFKTVDGHEIDADVYPGGAGERQPAVLFIHGGGLIMGSRKAILPNQVATFGEAGFRFVSIDYRLAPETKLPEIVTDIEDAWAWLRNEASSFGIDPNRIAILGHSAGGYLALLAGCRLRPRPAAVVSLAAYTELTGDAFAAPSQHYRSEHAPVEKDEARVTVGGSTISESGPNDSMQRYLGRGLFYLFAHQREIWLNEVSGHDPDDHHWYEQYQPLGNVSAEYPPTMLLHGEQDTDVPIEHSEKMQQELHRHGIPHDFTRHPEWGHAFLYMPNDASVDDAFNQIARFLGKYV